MKSIEGVAQSDLDRLASLEEMGRPRYSFLGPICGRGASEAGEPGPRAIGSVRAKLGLTKFTRHSPVGLGLDDGATGRREGKRVVLTGSASLQRCDVNVV